MRAGWWLVVVTWALLVGCDCGGASPRACELDRNCLEGEWCVMGQCVRASTDAGAGGGDAGTDGGGADGGGVPGPCDGMACGDVGYECRVDANDAGVCELAFSGIELLSPDGRTYGPDASVDVVARLVRKSGFSEPAPTTASFVVDGTAAGPGMQTGDQYSLQVLTRGKTEGPHAVAVTVAFADAGLSADGGFVVDATGPTLSLLLPGGRRRSDGGSAPQRSCGSSRRPTPARSLASRARCCGVRGCTRRT